MDGKKYTTPFLREGEFLTKSPVLNVWIKCWPSGDYCPIPGCRDSWVKQFISSGNWKLIEDS